MSVSRRVLDRVRTLALVSRLEGDPRYAERAWRELEAAAAFPDWNPAHFLDTAEMTHAFALGYDWLYDRWTGEQRAVLREAIINKGLREGMKVYESRKGWPRNENNWNQVCNGGLCSGALAIAETEPALAARIVFEAAQSLPLAMRHYEPDGAGTEGVTYWGYGSRYNIVLLSSLETALGTDFGLGQVGAFDKSGYYQIYLCGAGGVAFDVADCGRARVSEPQHFWLARKYDVPAYSWFRLNALERGQERGGALDLGSFIVDALGERWIIDSGVEHETYMIHRNKTPRPAYYRVRAEGHNVPVLNPDRGPDQNPRAVARIAKFESTPERALATVDLSQACQAHAETVLRTFTLAERKRLVVTDELRARKPAELWWFLHTEAQVALRDQGRTAKLSRNGKSFVIRLEEPAQAAFTIMDRKPLPSSPDPQPQADNRGRRKLTIHLEKVEATRIQVSMAPEQ